MTKKKIAATVGSLIFAHAMHGGCCCGNCGLTKKIDRLFSPLSHEQRMKKNFDDLFSSKKMGIKHTDEMIKLGLTVGEGIQTFNATMQDNQLVVDIPELGKKIVISYNKKTKFLSVGTEKKSYYAKASKDGAKEKESYRYETSHGSMQRGMTIKDNLDLTQAKIDYEGAILTISIPKIITKKETKKIKVNIK